MSDNGVQRQEPTTVNSEFDKVLVSAYNGKIRVSFKTNELNRMFLRKSSEWTKSLENLTPVKLVFVGRHELLDLKDNWSANVKSLTLDLLSKCLEQYLVRYSLCEEFDLTYTFPARAGEIFESMLKLTKFTFNGDKLWFSDETLQTIASNSWGSGGIKLIKISRPNLHVRVSTAGIIEFVESTKFDSTAKDIRVGTFLVKETVLGAERVVAETGESSVYKKCNVRSRSLEFIMADGPNVSVLVVFPADETPEDNVGRAIKRLRLTN